MPLGRDLFRRFSNLYRTTECNARPNRQGSRKSLGFETLEDRQLLSAAGLVDVGTQPDGALSGKIVYTHAGHGYTANNLTTGSWGYQRPLLLDMIEDLGNQDQMTFYADYLFRAGATVVPLRPVGHQPNEVIIDNDDTEVTYVGNWVDSNDSIYYGEPGDVPYRFIGTTITETAYARYRPNIPEAGYYPVYSWATTGSNRATDHLYRINHSGGITEVTVNHRRVGNGTVYLGTYYFEAGTDGYVDISNRSSAGRSVVIADMIRFGNGIGDIDRGGGISGLTREDEAGLYWVKWHVDRSQGIPDSEYRASADDGSATVSLSPRYAEYMNNSADGSLSDRVFVSFHSNAGGGSARGVLGLYNGNNNPNTATPNQFLLANTLALEVNDDLVDQNGQFEHNWFDRGTSVTLDRSDIEFGEINNLRINNEFDATIIETGFHDNTQDAQMLRDPKVRDALARATYQGVVKYFNNVDGGATPISMLPGQVTELSVESVGAGSVTLNWEQPTASDANGDAATGYMIYASSNGYGFDGGTYVAGGGTISHTINGLDSSNYYFKIAAVNSGGEGKASEVVAALPNGSGNSILIVNGFDRLSRSLNPDQNGAERVRPLQSNSFDYAIQVAEAIEANTTGVQIDTASNERIISGDIQLGDYDAVFWISGEESSADDTFNGTEQTLVSNYLSAGGKLFVSGAEIGWDLDWLNNGRSFYNNSLRADYVSDDAATYNVQGSAGSIFNGLAFSFDDGSEFYDVNFPDVISPLGGATTAMTYVGGTGGGAAIQYDSGVSTKLVNLGFPFETITTEANRNAVMERVLDFFNLNVDPLADFDSDGFVTGLDFLAWQRGSGTTGGAVLSDGDANFDGNVDGNDLAIWDTQYGTSVTVASFSTTPASAPLTIESPTASITSVAVFPETSKSLEEVFSSEPDQNSSSVSALADVVRQLTYADLGGSSQQEDELRDVSVELPTVSPKTATPYEPSIASRVLARLARSIESIATDSELLRDKLFGEWELEFEEDGDLGSWFEDQE